MKKYDIKQYCLVPPPYGGVTVYVSRLIRRLNHDGLSTGGFYSPNNKDEEVIESPLFDEDDYNPESNKIIRLLGHIKRIRIALHYRIIHFHGLETMVVPWVLMHVFKKKIIVTVHSAMIVNYYKTTGCFNRFFIKKLATTDSYWIAVSQQAKEEMLKLPFLFKNPIPIIPAYIPALSSSKDVMPNSMLEYIKGHKKNISFYGRSFMTYNGIDVYGFNTIIDLYSKVIQKFSDDIGLIICLSEDTEKDKINNLHLFAKQKEVDDLIYWQIGPLSSLQPLWINTDIYVRPTYTDGDSVAVREAIDAGMTVIASDVCQRPEGVITYNYYNFKELEEKCRESLKCNNRPPKVNDSFYEKMKTIYNKLL